MQVKLSLLCSSFNQGMYLRDLLHSLESQTFQNFEVIVIDNFSNDNSAEIFKNYSKVKIFQLSSTADEGYWEAFKLCCGEYVMSVSTSDFLFSSSWLKRGVDYLDSHSEISLVYTSSIDVDSNGEFKGISGMGDLLISPPSGVDYLPFWFVRHYLPELNYIIRKEVLKTLHYYIDETKQPAKFHAWIPYLFTRHGFLLKFIPDLAHAGRTHGGQLSSIDDSDRLVTRKIWRAKCLYALEMLKGSCVHTHYDGRGNVHSIVGRAKVPYVFFKALLYAFRLVAFKTVFGILRRTARNR